MKFEHLPTELFFIIFQYLYLHEIIYAFNQLNNRFRLLLLSYSPYYLDLSHPTIKLDFKIIKQILPYLSSIKSLNLSTKTDSVLNNKDFLSKYPLNSFYANLQCLSLDQFDDKQFFSLLVLLPKFQQLKSLSILKNNQIKIGYQKDENRDQIRTILLFQIKTLKILRWNLRDSVFGDQNHMKYSEERSTIEHYQFNSLDSIYLKWLHFHTPNLKSLHVSHSIGRSFLSNEPILNKLMYLKFDNVRSTEDLQFLINSSVSLIQLKEIQIQCEMTFANKTSNGDQWRNFIETYIPRLKVLKFFFTIYEKQELRQIEEFIQTFRTDFWIKEKKWFVIYDYEALTYRSYFYTTPCIKNQLEYSHSWKQISTKEQLDTTNIDHLTLFSLKSEQMSSYSRFSHVRTLILNNIEFDITYNQFNHLVNMLFLRKIIFQSEINPNFFFDLLKYVHQDISIQINENYLRTILQTVNEKQRNYLKKINGLELKNISNNNTIQDFIQNICFYFPNIKQLIINKSLFISDLNYLFNHLNKLSYFSMFYKHTNELDNKKKLQMLINNLKISTRKGFLFRLDGMLLQVFLSNPRIHNTI